MAGRGKKYKENIKKIERRKRYNFPDAIQLALDCSYAKFDEGIDVSLRLGVDPRHADRMVRGTVVLPNGTGKEIRVAVFAKGEKEKEAQEAGADVVGSDDLIEKIQKGWIGFDKAISTPDMMGVLGKVARVLGPKGLMPNPKTGTVTMDVTKAVTEAKGDKVNFRVDKKGNIHAGIGKVSFGYEKIKENFETLIQTINRAKPASAKGRYITNAAISLTMSPSVTLDASEVMEIK